MTGWLPLHLTAPVAPHVFGGRAIAARLGRDDLPDGRVAETWEVSDVDGMASMVVSGAWAGRSLRWLATEHPEEVVGRGWRGEAFPVLTKFIDAAGMLPVHLHADDATAQRLEGTSTGKTEAWHVLDAAPGATALCGTVEGVDAAELRSALLAGDFDAVLRRLPVRPGETIYVPAGTLHSFGPDTLVYEIEQTSDVQQHAMPWRMEDGSSIPRDEQEANIEALLAEWDPAPRPEFRPGLVVDVDDGVSRVVLTAGPYFALERWRVSRSARLGVDTATVLSNVGAPTTLRVGDHAEVLGRARTVLLPAAVGEVELDGPADVLAGYLPDLEADVRRPLLAAGHGAAVIAALGEGLSG
ncbi:class I mannose-6-phosphate isomerase [Actinomycetospora cinnamomea]|uniref:Mannose-6-phosphate isomerase n=1 Tax=Actinomycetospora cinnamomea TaxID=663609 RepID=A0A2U1EBH0_9PSEU|nr:class I mannose-6-phosphate isomerase [Actinomycetospora cinnamomea]PVY97316.1 mannose-6-phosphate isomerase [Actinomycetospora cinnamomea]